LRAFFAETAHGRRYVGKFLSIGDPQTGNRALKTQDFHSDNRMGMSIVQLVKFCKLNPELEEAALDRWTNIAAFGKDQRGFKVPHPLQEAILRKVENELLYGQEPAEQEQIIRLVDRVRSAVQWRRRGVVPYDSPRLAKWISSLELMPVDLVPTDELEALHELLISEAFTPKRPATLITSAVKATENLLTSSVKTELDRNTLTGILLSRLEAYDADNPLGYADFTKLANNLTPVLRRHSLDIDDLDPTLLEDFPRAIDRVLFMVLADGKSSLEQSGQLEKFELAAACIRKLAFKGVEGKLEQRVLSVGEIAMRYPHLSARQQRYLIERHQGRRQGLSETAIEATARKLKPANARAPRKPGWGAVS
jgi:hypothetical protein